MRRSARLFRPALDRLDSRIVPAAITALDLGLDRQVLNLQGTEDRDVILITDRFVRVNDETLAVPAGTVGIYADGNGGDDLILNLQGAVPVLLHGGSGDDRIATVPADHLQTNIVYGDQGDDILRGDPTRSVLIDDAVNYLTVDLLGGVAFFYDASEAGTRIEVFTDSGGTTHVVDETGETLLPPELKIEVGVFDLGPGDDTFLDSSESFRTIVYGGTGDDLLIADETHAD